MEKRRKTCTAILTDAVVVGNRPGSTQGIPPMAIARGL